MKYSFLTDLALTFSKINQYNYASLYILKHCLGELAVIRNHLANKYNFINHNEWNNFCNSEDYNRTRLLLEEIIKKTEQNFEACFNVVIPMVRNNYG